MLGYMTKAEARRHGFTHHGKYYGLPLYIAPEKGFMVATKISWLEPVMTVFHHIEATVRATAFPDREPTFVFQLGRPL